MVYNGEIGSTVSPSGVTKYVAYGSDLTVEAVPKEGYKFVKWSDGVTSAIRIDTDIVTYFNVLAICVIKKFPKQVTIRGNQFNKRTSY